MNFLKVISQNNENNIFLMIIQIYQNTKKDLILDIVM